jgi:succinate dehydrogenase / fumarate reductase flavoprotein subunit
MSNVEGLFVLGEANFSDHGANRLGASALMQGLADGYFIAPYTTASFLAAHLNEPLSTDTDAFRATEAEVTGRVQRLLSVGGSRTVDSFHRELGKLTWDACGISRTREGLAAAIPKIAALRERFWQDVKIAGDGEELNPSLEKAGRVADFFELAELMCRDALHREESCGGHFREEHQTPEGEAKRDDERFSYAAAWEFAGDGAEPVMHKENLAFEAVEPAQRSYK